MISDKRCWYNNSVIETLVFPGKEIPDGFVEGRLFHHRTFSEEHNKKLSEVAKGRKLTEEHKQHISNSLKTTYEENGPWNKGQKPNSGTWTKGNIPWNVGMTYDECHNISKEEMTEHVIATKTANNSFNKSQPEEDMYKSLCEQYGEDDIVRQYSDERYPFQCDFYIKSEDKFIELNLHPSHNGRPFDENNQTDIDELEKLKSDNSRWSKMIIDVWTIRDVKKLKIAKENNLNYQVIY